jgi:hypothetical protein
LILKNITFNKCTCKKELELSWDTEQLPSKHNALSSDSRSQKRKIKKKKRWQILFCSWSAQGHKPMFERHKW